MVDPLLSHPLVPIASPDDAAETLDSLLPYLAPDASLTVVHVVEKAGGAPDKASVEQREEYAEEAFELVRDRCADAGVTVETRVAFGTDVSETIFDLAAEIDASAIAFVPRGGSRLVQFLTGDTALDLITDTDRPVVALPGGSE
ncbi:universal stress protein [Haloarchaeobius sp. HRN-SO-5]|uniref:universal stress protein n=1 Tax=Haloarchaeobius sp. HRN-SO-5 TaxID=3446118 RepID=UPI003EB7C761